MPDRTKDQLLAIVLRALPYSEKIKNFDTQSKLDAIYFEWRGRRYRVSVTLSVEEESDGLLEMNTETMLMKRLLGIVALQLEADAT